MHIGDILETKRDGGELSEEEIGFFVQGVVSGSIPDYQASAWLMAVCIRGMTDLETYRLALAMRDSGERVSKYGSPERLSLDKHSTGGVGDKTTLVVVPILAAAGIPMLKMSGRGLGFSGGTVDKLESIPGFQCHLSLEAALAQVRKIGAALISQSDSLVPADKILYSLRDVTATVESIPLIASSIMSKKLAGGADVIVLDVKTGRGAFMKTREQAEKLAEALVRIGEQAGVPTHAVLTEMNEPLGRTVGNALEVREAWEMLRSPESAEPAFLKLCLELASHGLQAVGQTNSLAQGEEKALSILRSGEAVEKFEQIVEAQGGDLARLPSASLTADVFPAERGTLTEIHADEIGRLAMTMGAGRQTKQDPIDPVAGIEFHQKVGSSVSPGSPLATLNLRSQDSERIESFSQALLASCRISPTF